MLPAQWVDKHIRFNKYYINGLVQDCNIFIANAPDVTAVLHKAIDISLIIAKS